MCISLQKNRSSAFMAGDDDNNSEAQQQQRRNGGHHHHHHHPHRHFTVQHDYHDHAADSAPSFLHSAQELTPMRGSTSAPFPVKLYEMLERVEQDGFGHIVSWQPHGRCFVVHRPDLFKDLLARYFTLSKIASFQRQLNLYGFMRLTRGLDKGGYYHEMFLRGKPFLMRRIQRVKVKGTGVRARSNPEQEPNFWSMSWVGQPSPSQQEAQQGSSSAAAVVQSSSAAAATTMMARTTSSASIVSHDDETDERTTSRPASPPVVSSSSSSSEEDDCIMTGWGKTFYFLGTLPEPLDRRTVSSSAPPPPPPPPPTSRQAAAPLPYHPPMYSSKPAPVSSSSSAPTTSSMECDLMMDDLDLDDLVHDIVDGNFLDILERIIE